jgi:hypothetical protein
MSTGRDVNIPIGDLTLTDASGPGPAPLDGLSGTTVLVLIRHRH